MAGLLRLLPITVNQKFSLLSVMVEGSVPVITGDRAFVLDFVAVVFPVPEVVFEVKRLTTALFFFATA